MAASAALNFLLFIPCVHAALGQPDSAAACQRDQDWVTAARPRPRYPRSHQLASLSTSPHSRQRYWARTWLVCCCPGAWHCALLSPSVVPLLIACIESGVLSE